ncbi:NADH dehydrogenase subunit N [Streptomyces sp. DvalAA-14]|uniref:NADH-quinone oxidoreductase subunit N n=1 Tax=unclassified Streptomyces TaxID=2593676 RepID=UPI00081BA91C|nr:MULTISPECIES: NADH-quinone oxidoreductase subunit N [unclassified Streptomyces]MYS19086.1 NADH-quinone oxidoreductase subunit N [Streptomyces sp. SID4948]SCD36302.1 NADH dehydrogenase subunit N [Streptomyces sp. DvalAA-14]
MPSLVQSVDWTALTPVVIPAALAVVVLVADLFLPPERKALLGWVTAAGFLAAGLTLIPLRDGHRSTFCQTGGAQCSYAADHFALVIQVLVLGGALLTALLSLTAETADGGEAPPPGEYWFLLLSSAAGGALLPASRDLATLLVALEVTTLPAFALVALRRGDKLASEAALKFFLSSVTATAVSLLGISFVYAATGTLNLAGVAEGLGHPHPGFGGTATGQLDHLAKAGVALTLVGFAFKLAAAPFHFWVPDTYAGAPLPVAAYLSVVGKAAGFSGLILVTVVAFRPYADVWGPAIGVLAALTMTVGNVGALRQRPDSDRSAVRLLAWSSIGQAGYLLVPLAAASSADSPAHAIGTTVAYALMYGVVNLGAFAVAALVTRTAPRGRITDYRGLYASRPLAALALGFFLLCLAGLPPGVIGLFAKVAVFSSAVGEQHGWLAVIMAVNVVIALVYYLRWTALLFAGRETAGTVPAPAPTGDPLSGPVTGALARTPVGLAAAIALTAAAGIALSGAPQIVLRYAQGTLL